MIGIGISLSATTRVMAGAFNPASLFAAGQQGAWYDPSDLNTLFQDSAVPPIVPVTAAGQAVGTMLDKSGNNNHARQTTAADRPIYQTSGGLRWLNFDGISDRMTFPALVNMEHVLAGYLLKASTQQLRTLVSSGTDDVSSIRLQVDIPINRWRNVNTPGDFTDGTAASIRVNDVQTIAIVEDQAEIGLFRKRAASLTLTTIGHSTGPRFWFGNIYGLIMRDTAFSADEQAAAQTYMAAKSGVTL